MTGFFSHALFESRGVDATPGAPHCGVCGLYTKCQSPKLAVQGHGGKGILIVGPAPSAAEDKAGNYLAGKAGHEFTQLLASHGVDIGKDCWYTTAIICRSDSGMPTSEQVQACRPALLSTIQNLNPRLILLVGRGAVQGAIGHLWKEDVGNLDRWVGWQIPARAWNAWVCPLWHSVDFSGKTAAVQGTLQDTHLRSALALQGRPWDGKTIPDYEAAVECIYDTDKAAAILRKMIERGGRVAVDYETNMLNASGSKAKIVCCSASWEGRKTIAYPWQGEAIKATSELLLSPLKKIASNLKFETRWTLAHLGHHVENWAWDTMQSAHILNSVKGTASIKFQGFVLDGQPDYDGHIKPYLISSGPSIPNRVHEIPLRDLLTYCGVDSLLEFVVAEKQAKLAGMEL